MTMQQDPTTAPVGAPPAVDLDPLGVLFHASGPVMIVNWLLVAAAVAVWIVTVLELRKLSRLAAAERAFEAAARRATGAAALVEIARRHPDAPGARVVLSAAEHGREPGLIAAEARLALVAEEQRVFALFGLLSTVGSAGPFVGLFGTVWGILDAFLRIGRERSASLPVVAPAIGEALISTAMGLFAAIPAVVAFNVASKRGDDLVARVEAASGAWVFLLGGSEPVRRGQSEPPPAPELRPGEAQWARP
jgi:biopolymer transport protein TolQ